MKIITVANRKGGAGKSTCAAHLSIEAVKNGLKTILIDLDPQKTLEHWWEKRDTAEPFLAEASASNLDEKLKLLRQKGFDLCIIDTPGDVSSNASSAIKVSDLIVVPSKPTGPDLNAIGRTLQFLTEQEKPYVFVITQAISNSNLTLQAASILSEFGMVAPATISNRVSYAKALAEGISAVEIDNNARDEISSVWQFISSKVYKDMRSQNGKAKV